MTNTRLIDTHCHLDFEAFDADRKTVLENCQANNVCDIIVPAVAAATWPRTIAVTKTSNRLHLALGLHPMFIDQHQPQDLNQLDILIQQHSPIAVGEIGLDFYSKATNALNREKQLLFFTKQLIIARHHGLPVIIHNRKAHDYCLRLLAECQVSGGIVHAFNGSIQQAEKYIELGFLLGFGGMLTFPRSSKLRSLVKHLPLSSIVLETDAPDMTVAQHKGERNSPEYLPYIQTAVAEIRGLEIAEVASATTKNTHRVLGLNQNNTPYS